MARTPKKTSKGKRAKKGKIRDLAAGKKGKGAKGGVLIGLSQPTLSSPTLSSSTLTSSQLFSSYFK